MNDEIKEILDRLERIDHKEYNCGFEFADSGSFDEDCRCFEERKKMANYITNLQQENKQLKEELEYTIGIVEHNRIISEKNKEIHQLKDNWNKLKEYINYKSERAVGEDEYVYDEIYNEMQEIENGDSNEI